MKLLPTITSRLSGRGIVNIWGYNSWFVVRRRLGFAWYPGWCTRYTGTIDGNTDVWLITQHTPVGDEYYNNDNKNISYTLYSGELRIRLRFLSKIVKRHTQYTHSTCRKWTSNCRKQINEPYIPFKLHFSVFMTEKKSKTTLKLASWTKRAAKYIKRCTATKKNIHTHTAVNESR